MREKEDFLAEFSFFAEVGEKIGAKINLHENTVGVVIAPIAHLKVCAIWQINSTSYHATTPLGVFRHGGKRSRAAKKSERTLPCRKKKFLCLAGTDACGPHSSRHIAGGSRTDS